MSTKTANPSPSPVAEKMYRLGDLPELIRLGRRTIERMLAAGQFPAADRVQGRIRLWRGSTVARWQAGNN